MIESIESYEAMKMKANTSNVKLRNTWMDGIDKQCSEDADVWMR